MTDGRTRVAYWTTTTRHALDVGGRPFADVLWQVVRDGLSAVASREGLVPPSSIDIRIIEDTADARAGRQDAADAEADEQGVPRWAVPEIVTFHAEAWAAPQGAS